VTARQRVAVVTGGGGGIGAAIAEELGRGGWHVVTVDPLVTLDGTEQLPEPEETTAGRIVAAGGSARASSASVTDAAALRDLFGELADQYGGLDAVVNVAGITRQSYFAQGSEDDFVDLLTVHLGGYLNVLGAALPLMAKAGAGSILGVTSGSGWRAADAGGYSSAKRAVAALTWHLGRHAPPGVTVNAISPIAGTRMVAAALERARKAGRAGGGGGLTLDSMPGPEDLGPLGAYLVDPRARWCSGQVLFAGGPEVAVVDRPRLVEVVRTAGAVSVEAVLDAVLARAFVAAEAAQATEGGSNPRFGPIFEAGAPEATPADVRTCAVVSDRPAYAAAVIAALEARSITCVRAHPTQGFEPAAQALRAVAEGAGPLDAVVTAIAGPEPAAAVDSWEGVLRDHHGILQRLHLDAAWARAAADYAAGAGRPVRLVTLSDARSPAGQSRGQSAAQLARVAGSGTQGRLTAFAVSTESPRDEDAEPAAALVGQLLGTADAAALAGAELAVGEGWIGLRSHPRPIGTITYGGPAIPPWLDPALREIVGATGCGAPEDR
jgi:NAD(P)-dependent dehydrogenase (short-subunit alcohol dehydrogenase family)